MKDLDRPHSMNKVMSWKASAIMLAFGLALLAFLSAIERPQWFKLRPASGTAAAMATAAVRPGQTIDGASTTATVQP